MSKKYEKTILLSPAPGANGLPRLKATVAYRLAPKTLPVKFKEYSVTGPRTRHLQRMLLSGARRKVLEAEQVTDDGELARLAAIIADLLRTVVTVAKVAEVGYGIPMSQDAIDALATYQLFQILQFKLEQENEAKEQSPSISGHHGNEAQPGGNSFPFVQSSFG